MTLAPIKTPVVAKKMFPNYIWDIPVTDKSIYLTFDDGPTPEITQWVLNLLKKYNAKATFFCIGENIEKHPDIFQNIIENGHSIGNHTQNHIKGWKTKSRDYLKNIADCESEFKTHITNPKSSFIKLFRPPYGQITPKQGKKLIAKGYKIIMWDVLSFDWDKSVNNETCLKNVISKAKEGSIIVFHDSIKASKNMQYALPKVLEYFTEKGYELKAIS
ncbi:polysaccharide deacetylase family protein [Seonamhaeicola maritimus]|uniref:polysaccharide deacetylase family protein n=1 Tax=Seonamhaeicola maritimus TaxID=2591822 RepID=UPI0024959454|nr:polysaccharide deacetylase family protein [Seonamhaeicola maritimus]